MITSFHCAHKSLSRPVLSNIHNPLGQLTQKGCIFRLSTPGLPKGQSDFGLSGLRLTMPKLAEAGNALPGSCLLITQAGRQVKFLGNNATAQCNF